MAPRQRASSEAAQPIRIPVINADPLASLRIARIRVELGGEEFIVPALKAAEWLEILLADELNVEEIFPGMCGPDAVIRVNRMALTGQVQQEELERAILDLVEAASGRQWWVTLRLCRFVRTNWDRIGGTMAARGVNPFQIPLAMWIDAAYSISLDTWLNSGKPQDATKFVDSLLAAPPGEAKQAFDLERNQAAFRAAMSMAKG